MYSEMILLLFAHWIGDYVLQTNEMAVNKYRSLKWLSIHVSVYCIPLGLTAFVLFQTEVILHFIVITAVTHWLTDFLTSRLAFRYKVNPRLYYPIIGLDQFVHAATLISTAHYVHSINAM